MTNNYINLQEEDLQVTTSEPEKKAEENHSSKKDDGEMSDIETEMFSVAESAFNRKRAQAHEEIDKLYDEMIKSAKSKVKGLTASIVAEVSGQ